MTASNIHSSTHVSGTSLKHRFVLLAMLVTVMVVLPCSVLIYKAFAELREVRAEQAGAPHSLTMFALFDELQTHRQLSQRALTGDKSGEPARVQGFKRYVEQSQALRTKLVDTEGGDGLANELQAMEVQVGKLSLDVGRDNLTARESYNRHLALATALDNASARLLARSGLLVDGNPASYFYIVAAFQEGKTVGELLGQLQDLGHMVLVNKGATALDLNEIASLKAKLEDRSRFFSQNLMLAGQFSGKDLSPELQASMNATTAGLVKGIALAEQTFLGMSPDWSVTPATFATEIGLGIKAQRDLTRGLVDQVLVDLGERARRLTVFVGVLSFGVVVLLLVGAVLMHLTMRSVMRPLQQCVAHAQALAQGDLSVSFASKSTDEMGSLLNALEAMRLRWAELVHQLQTAADQVNAATGEIAHGNHDLSTRTEKTATQLQQASFSVGEMGLAFKQSADSAATAERLSQTAMATAQRGGLAMDAVVDTMRGLQTSSGRIGEIVSLINGIAFQTNILALNAAVEAARAGDQGRGFAVVASEVRTLAQRTTVAANDIKTLIGASLEQVSQGATLVTGAGGTMNEIVRSVEQVSAIVLDIARSAKRQNAEIADIGQVVKHLDGMTQQNSALVEESAAAAFALQEQAEQLKAAVGWFRLDAGRQAVVNSDTPAWSPVASRLEMAAS